MFIQNRVHVFIAGRKIKYVQTWTFSKQFFSSTVNPIRAFQNTDTGSRDMAVLQKLMGAWRHKRVLRTRQFNTRNRLNAHGYMARYRKYHFSSRRWSVFREKKSIENYTFPNYTFPPGRRCPLQVPISCVMSCSTWKHRRHPATFPTYTFAETSLDYNYTDD